MILTHQLASRNSMITSLLAVISLDTKLKKDDLTVYAALLKAPSFEYVNVSRWYSHFDTVLRISGVSADASGVTVEGFTPISEEAIATPLIADSKDYLRNCCTV